MLKAMLALTLAAAGALADWDPYYHERVVEGYAPATSVVQGGSIDFHVTCEESSFHIEFYRQGESEIYVGSSPQLPGVLHPTNPEPYGEGCGWPVSYTLDVPPEWPSGLYFAKFVAESGAYSWTPFVVRAANPGSTSRILFICSFATYQSHNLWGGKSLYFDDNHIYANRARWVSYHRPYRSHEDFNGKSYASQWEVPAIKALTHDGFVFEYATTLDLHENPDLLRPYRAFMTIGHDEYHSKETFDHLEEARESGRNLAFFGANQIYRQVRFEGPDTRTQVCYKAWWEDPLYGIDNERVTVMFHAFPVFRPASSLVGGLFNLWDSPFHSPVSTDFTVVDASHWAFEGLGVSNGDTFAPGRGMVRGELDKRHEASPPNTRVLLYAITPSMDGEIMMECEATYYEHTPEYGFPNGSGAMVFNAATTGWRIGFYYQDEMACQFSENIISRFSEGFLRSPDGFLKEGWNLVSVPCNPQDPSPEAVLDRLVVQGNAIAGALYRYSGGVYEVYPTDFTELEQGRGYWLKLTSATWESAQPASNDWPEEFHIPLTQGWNLIGNPYDLPVKLEDCRIVQGTSTYTLDEAEAAGLCSAWIWGYDSGYKALRQGASEDTRLRPWRGYWLQTSAPDLELLVPLP